ncbi:sugar ABC transporter permease [Meiothermus sp. QL-1]|uniref:ABC transporter permease subunit n=1 Tax=Meiothermus sp. QL-1 TaxID=2058095 RepID=UPI000E0A8CDE|nr:sugar ABC transporter permease [Meiothermus sp. QL-1]RDI95429.1 sugar ABC transporter permease [Meiothermus sp. QL-1]
MTRFFRKKDNFYGFLVILPSLVLLGVFVYGFILQTFLTSLTDWGRDPAQALSANPQIRFIGFENYRELFTGFVDARFRQDLANLFFFTVFFLIGCLGLGLALAIALDRGPRGEGFFRTVFLFPMALSFIVTGTIWRWMLQPEGGVNQLPTLVGLPKGDFAWLTSREQVWRFSWNDLPFFTALVVGLVLAFVAVSAFCGGQGRRGVVAAISAALVLLWGFTLGRSLQPLPYDEYHGFNLALIGIILAAVWQMSGYTMALYLAGLRGIPEELREAARVDGASEWQLYRYVIFPLLAPITLSAMIILGHISLKIFDLVFAMAGPDNAPTDVPALLMYITTFRANQIAKGAAIGIILLVMVALVIVPYLYRQLRSEVRR